MIPGISNRGKYSILVDLFQYPQLFVLNSSIRMLPTLEKITSKRNFHSSAKWMLVRWEHKLFRATNYLQVKFLRKKIDGWFSTNTEPWPWTWADLASLLPWLACRANVLPHVVSYGGLHGNLASYELWPSFCPCFKKLGPPQVVCRHIVSNNVRKRWHIDLGVVITHSISLSISL
jgi:hypothetical protein